MSEFYAPIYKKNSAYININGRTIVGNNILMKNGSIIVDGEDVTDEYAKEEKNITIVVDGDINELTCTTVNDILLKGNVGDLKTTSGDVEIRGDIGGNVKTVSGDIIRR